MAIHLSKTALGIIRKDLEKGYPNEACGFFYGKITEGERFVTEIHPVKNAKEGDQRRRFEIDPHDYMRAELYALDSGLTLLGIYHSHPEHPSIPSEHDLRQAVPFFSYIIASVKKGHMTTIQSWRLDETANIFKEEPLEKESLITNH